MTNKTVLILAILSSLLLTSCGVQETTQSLRRPETAEEREVVAEMILKLCEASNPMSDEEPEDMIRQAQKTAWSTLCPERIYTVSWDRASGATTYTLHK